MANFNTGSLNPVLSVFLLFNQNTIHLGCTPWQHAVVFTASICLHSWSLRACAEPRRAEKRKPQAPPGRGASTAEAAPSRVDGVHDEEVAGRDVHLIAFPRENRSK